MRQRSLLLLLLVLVLGPTARCLAASDASAASGAGDDEVERKRRHKGPWFCHGRDCPRFETEREADEYSLRCYERSTWAVSCAYNVHMGEGVLRATANVLRYVKEHDLWGATPFAHVLHLSLENQQAWNASAAMLASHLDTAGTANHPDRPDPLGAASSGDAVPAVPDLDLGCVHKTVCAAYFLPDKYQGTPQRTEVDRRPPRPGRKSGVCIVRAPRFEAYATGFPGFPSPARFMFNSLRLVHHLHWHQEPFDWTTALFYIYDPPTASSHRWNEVLVPRKRWHHLLLEEGQDVWGTCGGGDGGDGGDDGGEGEAQQ